VARRIIVVGASLGGIRAAEQLRAAGWTEEITVVGAEPHMPYNRPPLSKDLVHGQADLTGASAAEVLQGISFPLRHQDIEWRLGEPAVGLDADRRLLTLEGGDRIRYDGLVAATGLRSRRLLGADAESGRYVLRTVDDALALGAELRPGVRLVVVGAGFIGSEIAAVAATRGCEVTVVEPLDHPMQNAIGADLGAAIRTFHEAHGVGFRLGRLVAGTGADGVGRIASVEFDDGEVIACDVLVEAVGSIPNVEWLEGNGLDLSDGVLCDDWMAVPARPEVVAVGDVARFPNPLFDEPPRRVEHWCVPTETARRAARGLVATLEGEQRDLAPFTPLHSFWSDQFELRIQGLGAFAMSADRLLLAGDLERIEEGVAVGTLSDGKVVGVVTVGLAPAALRAYRTLLARGPVELSEMQTTTQAIGGRK
jgi:3-phenylpropionate/trans-cinnamate dioxygenase ferredoxin reductase component